MVLQVITIQNITTVITMIKVSLIVFTQSPTLNCIAQTQLGTMW